MLIKLKSTYNPIRNSDMVKASVKGNLDVLSVQRKTTRASIVITI